MHTFFLTFYILVFLFYHLWARFYQDMEMYGEELRRIARMPDKCSALRQMPEYLIINNNNNIYNQSLKFLNTLQSLFHIKYASFRILYVIKRFGV